MPPIGAFTFVLHSHLPYARLAGQWPHGEEWIHEAASETYIPLLQTLYDLKAEGIAFRLTLGLTPTLLEQLADPLVMEHFEQFLSAKITAAERDQAYFGGAASPELRAAFAGFTPEPDKHLHYLAGWYKAYYEKVRVAFHDHFNRDLIGAFRHLQDEGYIEIIASAATHGYLPLLAHDSSIRSQISIGIDVYERMFGRRPSAFWLPECAYRPAYVEEGGQVRAGLEHFLGEQGIQVFFAETHSITGGQPVGVAAGEVIGPYGEIRRRYVIPPVQHSAVRKHVTTFQAYYAEDTAGGAGAAHSGVVVIGRNNRTGQQVWSADWGYPGDFDYREFHKKAGTSGLQYWRVTGAKTNLAHKDYYHPEWAAYKIDQHAEHFAHLVGDLLREYHTSTGEFGLIASGYDTELFGHWWFEGVTWLGKVLRNLAHNPEIMLITASDYVRSHPPQQALLIPEGSWGTGGTHFTWHNGETHWMWPPIHAAEARMEALASRYTAPSEDERLVLNQAARELLLLQSSDWPFLISTGQAREYAIQRFNQHFDRFTRLANSLDADQPNAVLARELYEQDKLFADIDYALFAPR